MASDFIPDRGKGHYYLCHFKKWIKKLATLFGIPQGGSSPKAVAGCYLIDYHDVHVTIINYEDILCPRPLYKTKQFNVYCKQGTQEENNILGVTGSGYVGTIPAKKIFKTMSFEISLSNALFFSKLWTQIFRRMLSDSNSFISGVFCIREHPRRGTGIPFLAYDCKTLGLEPPWELGYSEHDDCTEKFELTFWSNLYWKSVWNEIGTGRGCTAPPDRVHDSPPVRKWETNIYWKSSP